MRYWGIVVLICLLLLACEEKTIIRDVEPISTDSPLPLKNTSILDDLFQKDLPKQDIIISKEATLMQLYQDRLGLLKELNQLYFMQSNKSLSSNEQDLAYVKMITKRNEKDALTDKILALEDEVEELKIEHETEARKASLSSEIEAFEESVKSLRSNILDFGDRGTDLRNAVLSATDPQVRDEFAKELKQIRDQEYDELEELCKVLDELEKDKSELLALEDS